MNDTVRTTTSPKPGLSMRSTLLSEKTKLRSIRAIVWLLAIGGAFIALLGPFQALGEVVAPAPGSEVGDLDSALSIALTGFSTSVILFGIAGTLVVTSEYPRPIRTTFAVVPRRSYVVYAKLLATARAVLVLSLATSVIAVVASAALLAKADIDLSLTDARTARAVLGVACYSFAWAAFGQALGWLMRSTVGAVISLLGLMFVVPALVTLLPRAIVEVVYPVLPSQAAAAMLGSGAPELTLSPLVGYLVVTAYIVIGFVLISRVVSARDA